MNRLLFRNCRAILQLLSKPALSSIDPIITPETRRRVRTSRGGVVGALGLALAAQLRLTAQPAEDPFQQGVRTSDPLAPAGEALKFRLPAGFEMQLVASEPDILKPMNMAFDARGRLWVTDTREYPYPVPLDQPARDSIKVLEDIGANGRPLRIRTFANGLNIPIGLYPYQTGVVAWSIPNIWHFEDTNNDGSADQKKVLFGPLGWQRDTHGNNASFRRGFDGWLYATHGYNNETTLVGKDGSRLQLQSGNTYRIRLDGSRVEPHTWGQVNPFGMCFDALGNIFTADCHSAPIYQLLRGAYYPSFGKPDDGLGFGPVMLHHTHGSTAIGGIAIYEDNLFPPEFRGDIFVGNVMTSRVHRDRLTATGSTLIATELEDLIRSDDPWFRPVDTQLGPDGAIYIADFYNRIIGHYEVPLAHPGRDRERGRIWRLVYRGSDGKLALRPPRDLTRSTAEELIAAFDDPNLTYRILAMSQLVDRVGPSAAPKVDAALKSGKLTPVQTVHALWSLHQLGGLEPQRLELAAKSPDRLLRVHTMRILSETQPLTTPLRDIAVAGLQDPDAFVRRQAADALGLHPSVENIRPLIELRRRTPTEDTHTMHSVRMSLRNQLQGTKDLAPFFSKPLDEADSRVIADVATGWAAPGAATFLLEHLERYTESPATTANHLRHVARFVPRERMEMFVAFTQKATGGNVDFESAIFKSVQEGMKQRGMSMDGPAHAWGQALATRLLESIPPTAAEWMNRSIEGLPGSFINPWTLEQRHAGQGQKPFLSSLPRGEGETGILRSPRFKIPEKFSFLLAGHDGTPVAPARQRNDVRLVDAATAEVLVEAPPPRSDDPKRISWDLQRFAGRSGYLEVKDGDDSEEGYAWIAIGEFDPPVISVPSLSPAGVAQRQVAAAQLASMLHLASLEEPLSSLVKNEAADPESRAAAVQALLQLNPTRHLPLITPLLSQTSLPSQAKELIGQSLQGSPESRAVLLDALKTAPRRLQTRWAQSLASTPDGAERLIDAVAQHQIPISLLFDRRIKDKLSATAPEAAKQRMADLLKDTSAPPDEKQYTIDQSVRQYAAIPGNPAEGARIYEKNCAVCHRIRGVGGLVGPQLDGIGNRGLERVAEDILDPNRNLDVAFRTTLFVMDDGDVTAGLFRREEGEVVVVAESTGKEITLSRGKIRERRESETSVMPENFSEVIPPQELKHLLAYLLAKDVKPENP